MIKAFGIRPGLEPIQDIRGIIVMIINNMEWFPEVRDELNQGLIL